MNYGPINPKMTSMLHGGDYNPDQWINYENIWNEDFRLMDLAKVNTMSIGIFSWMALEPEEGKYEFGWMDEIMDRLAAEGKYAVLATPSGARPIWISQKYPEVLRVNADRTKNLHGERHNHCYTSPAYREKTRQMNEQLATRYKDHPALLVWHISNEFGGECHCDLCQAAFRDFLRDKYDHDIEKLNHAWWTSFWAHKYTDFEQIESPSPLGEHSVHGHNLDWKRFVTHQMTDFMVNEMAPLREITPDVPITTNFMETFEGLNYWEMAKPLDVMSWDSYPVWHKETSDVKTACRVGFYHDVLRSLKGGKPFMLMESTPSTTNWQPVSKLKRPGMHLLSSLQAVAHGSDTVQYFQWRKSRGSCEKFHGAVVDHVGHEHTRVFRDVTSVGEALTKLDKIVGTSVQPQVAVIYDWENRWAINNAHGINNAAKKYTESVLSHYMPFWQAGVSTDVIDMNQSFDGYKVVIAPMLYMLKPGVAERIEAFVKNGGTFVATYVTGFVDETDLCFLGGFPGPLKATMGIWDEETDSLQPNDRNYVSVNIPGLEGKRYEVKDMCDLIHLEGAKALGQYEEDFYAGRPALTVNTFGEGKSYFIAFRNNGEFEMDFYQHLIHDLGLKTILPEMAPEGVSVTTRYDDDHRFVFIMNFNKESVSVKIDQEEGQELLSNSRVAGQVELEPYGVKIIQY